MHSGLSETVRKFLLCEWAKTECSKVIFSVIQMYECGKHCLMVIRWC